MWKETDADTQRGDNGEGGDYSPTAMILDSTVAGSSMPQQSEEDMDRAEEKRLALQLHKT